MNSSLVHFFSYHHYFILSVLRGQYYYYEPKENVCLNYICNILFHITICGFVDGLGLETEGLSLGLGLASAGVG